MQRIPQEFTAGLTFSRLLVENCYPAPAWSLKLLLRGPGAYEIYSAPGDNGQHQLTATATDTAAWLAGTYSYSLRATDGTQVAEIDAGTLEIKPDLAATAAGADQRGHVRRVLESIEAVIENRATMDQMRYKINNRELWRTPLADLLRLRTHYKNQLVRLQMQKSGKFGRTVKVRL